MSGKNVVAQFTILNDKRSVLVGWHLPSGCLLSDEFRVIDHRERREIVGSSGQPMVSSRMRPYTHRILSPSILFCLKCKYLLLLFFFFNFIAC